MVPDPQSMVGAHRKFVAVLHQMKSIAKPDVQKCRLLLLQHVSSPSTAETQGVLQATLGTLPPGEVPVVQRLLGSSLVGSDIFLQTIFKTFFIPAISPGELKVPR